MREIKRERVRERDFTYFHISFISVHCRSDNENPNQRPVLHR